MEQKQNKRIKTAIIILAVLLGISIMALIGTICYSLLAHKEPATAKVPDNLITPGQEDSSAENLDASNAEANTTAIANANTNTAGIIEFASCVTTTPVGTASETSAAETLGTAQNDAMQITLTNSGSSEGSQSGSTSGEGSSGEGSGDSATTPAEPEDAITIELHKRQAEDNEQFQVENMFPGDSITKYFCVKVSYKGAIDVHFKATEREGYEKLAEVLKVRVKVLNSGKTIYDGPIKNMPDQAIYKLNSQDSTTDEIYYEITAYLDTSVGNEYQNKELIADFSWWVADSEAEQLQPAAKTGDYMNITLWASLVAVFGVAIIVLLIIRRHKEAE